MYQKKIRPKEQCKSLKHCLFYIGQTWFKSHQLSEMSWEPWGLCQKEGLKVCYRMGSSSIAEMDIPRACICAPLDFSTSLICLLKYSTTDRLAQHYQEPRKGSYLRKASKEAYNCTSHRSSQTTPLLPCSWCSS